MHSSLTNMAARVAGLAVCCGITYFVLLLTSGCCVTAQTGKQFFLASVLYHPLKPFLEISLHCDDVGETGFIVGVKNQLARA